MLTEAIICVDDEKMILESLHAQLERFSGGKYLLEFAESAAEAQELIESMIKENITIHAVIADWGMPAMKGDEFLYWVAKKSPSTKLILLSGYIEEENIKEIERNKTHGIKCVYKPWSSEQLISYLD